jgi:hypothetical protein
MPHKTQVITKSTVDVSQQKNSTFISNSLFSPSKSDSRGRRETRRGSKEKKERERIVKHGNFLD